MKWKGRRASENVDDQRGAPGRRPGVRIGGGMAIVALLAALLLGVDPTNLLGLLAGGGGLDPSAGLDPGTQGTGVIDPSDEDAQFVAVVLGSTEDAWIPLFEEAGAEYRPPRLVLYTDEVESACGYSTAATGPFYCPGDDRIYIDLGFLSELERLGAPGDFAFAYVIAHEVGHHIQNLLGIEREARRAMSGASATEANAVSVRLELQADCFAGIWAHSARQDAGFLESGDLEEGLAAAAAVGDDRLQRAAGRRVQPESFTHGSAADRAAWFRRGLESGTVETCDTFRG